LVQALGELLFPGRSLLRSCYVFVYLRLQIPILVLVPMFAFIKTPQTLIETLGIDFQS